MEKSNGLAFLLDGPLDAAANGVFGQLLKIANVERRDALILTLYPERPENDDYAPWMADADLSRPHLEALGDHLRRAAPTVIVPMGAAGLAALGCGVSPASARGALTRASLLAPGTKVLPTYGPLWVLRQWKFFHVVADDIARAAAEAARGPLAPITLDRRELWLEPTLFDLSVFAAKFLSQSTCISVDIETMPSTRQISCIGFAPDAERALVVPFIDWRKPSRSYWATVEDEVRAWEWCAAVCGNDTPKVLQNGTYDAFWLWDIAGIALRNYRYDTRLLHHALYPEMPKDLGFMGNTYINAGAWKTMRTGSKPQKKDD